MNIDDLPDESDTSDDDYVPNLKPEDLPSEAESDGQSEDALSDVEDLGSRRGKKRKKMTKKAKKSSQDSGTSEEIVEEKPEDKKKKEEDIWADFMKDTGFKSKSSTSDSKPTPSKATTKKPEEKPQIVQKPVEKVKVVQVFEFAGEEVKVEKEVAADSAEARLLSAAPSTPKPGAKAAPRGSGLKGISSVLSQIGKKQKISTLEKSKLDWDKFKQEENLEEELSTYNKGKDGYLERQDFLQRADLRRFEIERDIRTIERNKRLNNTS